MAGWIALHRSFTEHWLFDFDQPDKALAWIDLLLSANHEDRKFMIKGQLILCKRGQVAMSQVTLAARWKWSRNKVKRFLDMLEKDGMIVQQAKQLNTIITICNYSQYQDIQTADEAADEAADEHRTKQQTSSRRAADEAQTTIKQLNNITNSTTVELVPEKRKSKDRKKNNTPIPADFCASIAVIAWYQEQGYTESISKHLASFVLKCQANGYTYADWDAAFKNAIREDWAKLRISNPRDSPPPKRTPTKTNFAETDYGEVSQL